MRGKEWVMGYRGNSPSDSQTSQQLVPQTLRLSHRAQPPVLNLLRVKFQTVLRELEPLANKSGQFPDATTFFTENVLSVGGTDDDLGFGVGGTDFTAGVTFFGEFAGAAGEGRGGGQ